MVIMAGGAVSWKSKKQGCVAQSSSEAEYMALASAVKEAIWLHHIFGLTAAQSEKKPVLVFVDNQGAIKMAKNESSSTRTQHIDISIISSAIAWQRTCSQWTTVLHKIWLLTY